MTRKHFAACFAMLLAVLSAAPPALALDMRFSPTPGNTPGALKDDTLGINRADGKLFWKRPDGSPGVGTLLDATAAGRSAVEQGDASGLSVTIPGSPMGLPLNQRLAGTVDIREVGLGVVDTTGVTAVDDIVSKWLTKAMATGKPATAPCGTYAMAAGLSLTMTGDLEIALPRCVVFKSMSSITKPILELKDNSPGGGHKYSLVLRGGTFDNALGVFVVAAQSNSGLSLTRLRKVLIDGVVFKGAPTYTAAQTTTDTAIEGADLQQVTITNNFIDGQGDVGIYLGGNSAANDNSDDGYQCIVASNHFSNSQQALALKREGGGCNVYGNTMWKMYSGINALDAGGLNGGRSLVIANNWAKYIETSFVTLRASSDNYVTNNYVEDFGFAPDGVTTSAVARAIRIMGSSGTKVRGNRIALRDWTQGARGSAGHAAITVEDYTTTIGGVSQTLTPDGLTYDSNDIANVQIAVQELSATAGPSFGTANTYTNVGQRLAALNASSQYRFYDPSLGGERTIAGTAEVARTSSNGTFTSRLRTFLNTIGLTKIDQLSSQTVTWGSIAAGAYAPDQTVAFTGARLGDVIRITPLSPAGQPAGLELTAVVLADDQVTLRAKNGGAATLNMTTSYQYKITLLRTG